MAFTIEQVQRPALVIAHNKTLAAQLCNEFREFLPNNAVEYFVSYYDYYQPEAYVPQQDLYIEKDSSINDEIDRLRHSATAALLGRRDVIVVASVSCIYGLGSPEQLRRPGRDAQEGRDGRSRRDAAQARGQPLHAQRHGPRPRQLPGARRDARGLPGLRRDRLPGRLLRRRDRAAPALRPAHRRGVRRARARRHLAGHPLRHRPPDDRARGRRDPRRAGGAHQGARGAGQAARVPPAAPAHPVRHGDDARARLLQRDRELLAHPRRPRRRATGPTACSTSSRTTSSCFIDESHQTVPQIGGMYEGDRSRKQTLVDYGFRLPSAMDNRPQTFDEFLEHHQADRVRLGHAGRVRAQPLLAHRRADRAARPASSTPRSRCARPRTRSTT